MIIADWAVIIGVVVCCILGAILGFGKCLKFFTKGIFGIIISVIVCYCVGGTILHIGFMQDLLAKIASGWTGKEGFFYNFLTKIRLEVVIFYILLFIVVQLARILIVSILKSVVEANNVVMKVINKFFGAVLMTAFVAMLALLVLQIIYWVGGSTAENVENALSGSLLQLNKVFTHNPIAGLVDYIKNALTK